MSRRASLHLPTFGVAAFALIALVFSGLTHTWHHKTQGFDPAIATYLAAGGTLSDICASRGGETRGSVAECDACHMKSTAHPTPVRKLAWLDDRTFLYVAAPETDRIASLQALDLSRACRAPPVA